MTDLQKASVFKRMAAGIFDFIIVTIITVGCFYLLSAILRYDDKENNLNEYRQSYIENYDVDFYGTTESQYNEEFTDELREAYAIFMQKYNLVFNLTLIMITFGVLIGIMVVHFVIPLFLKDGMTIGKKCFSICLMKQNHVKVKNVNVFARALLGKFAVETMVPIYLIMHILSGLGTIFDILIGAALILTQLITIIVNKNNALIHDLIAYTVVVDRQSQMIFDSEEQMIEYKKERQRKEALKATY